MGESAVNFVILGKSHLNLLPHLKIVLTIASQSVIVRIKQDNIYDALCKMQDV